MNYFKTNLIIIIFHIFITFHDVYGGIKRETGEENSYHVYTRKRQRPISAQQRSTNQEHDKGKGVEGAQHRPINTQQKLTTEYQEQNEDKKDAQQTPFNKQCVETLETVHRSREKNYLDHYVDFFNEAYNDESSAKYDENIDMFVTTCLVDPSSILEAVESDNEGQKISTDNTQKTEEDIGAQAALNKTKTDNYLDIMFTCDVIFVIYDLIDLQNTSKYCNIMENNPHYSEPDGMLACKNELGRLGFTFEHGLDNYVYLILKLDLEAMLAPQDQKQDEDKKVEGENEEQKNVVKVEIKIPLTKLQHEYIQYLTMAIAHITEKSTHLGSTIIWCELWECESNLNDGGFESRLYGEENNKVVQTKYEENCDKIESDTVRDYCEYLEKNEKDPTINLSGTLEWCMNRVYK